MKLHRLDMRIIHALARPYLNAALTETPRKPGLPQSQKADVVTLQLALRPRIPPQAKPDFASQFDRGTTALWSKPGR
jgi:hypothetical protein